MITMHTTRKPMSHRIRDARSLLAAESDKARRLLNAEAARVRNEATAKEAFIIPSVLLARVVMALFPGIVPNGSREYDTAAEVFRAEGWKVDDIATYLRTTAKREPLRQLSEILDAGATRGPWVEGVQTILEAIDGFHGNMVVNSKRAWNDRIPAPQITYTPATAEQEE